MVNFPPYIPSAQWFGNFLKSLVREMDYYEAVKFANSNLDSPREFGRFCLKERGGKIMTLSIPVEGGGRQLRSWRGVKDCCLSEHGDWRKVHLGALESCLGRRPFYREIETELSPVIFNKELKSLRDFNSAIFSKLLSFLMGNLHPVDLNIFYKREDLRLRGIELAERIDPGMTSLEPITLMGREALLGLLSLSDLD